MDDCQHNKQREQHRRKRHEHNKNMSTVKGRGKRKATISCLKNGLQKYLGTKQRFVNLGKFKCCHVPMFYNLMTIFNISVFSDPDSSS